MTIGFAGQLTSSEVGAIGQGGHDCARCF